MALHRHAIINQKGGVTKTTTSVNLAAALGLEFGKRVLLIDLCAQGHSSEYVGRRVSDIRLDSPVYRVLARAGFIPDLVQKTSQGFDLLAGGPDAEQAEIHMAAHPRGQFVLKQAIDDMPQDLYDIVLFDCPPSLSFLSRAALIASTGFCVPMLMHGMSLDGFDLLLSTVEQVRERDNPLLAFVGVLGANTKKDSNHSNNIRDTVRERCGDLVFEREIRYSEYIVQGFGVQKPVVQLAPTSIGADDYRAVCKEIIDRGAA